MRQRPGHCLPRRTSTALPRRIARHHLAPTPKIAGPLGLWRYCLNLFPDIAGKVQHWNTNDGDGLDAEDAMALSRLLEETLEDGTARDYQRGFAEYLANIPDTNCYRCNGDGQVRGFVELTHPAQADDPESGQETWQRLGENPLGYRANFVMVPPVAKTSNPVGEKGCYPQSLHAASRFLDLSQLC